jgi:NADPH-dependent ferric siderophore reductase
MQLTTVAPVRVVADAARGSLAEVLVADDIGPELRRVIIAAPAVFRCDWRPGQTVDVLVESVRWRTYLIADLDPVLCRVELVVSTASGGPGAVWAASTGPGDELRIRGPSGPGLVDVARSRHVLVGDETAIGFAIALSRARLAMPASGILELPSWSTAAVVRLKLPFEVVVMRPGSPGVFAARVLDAIGTGPGYHHVVGSSTFTAQVARVLDHAAARWHGLVTWEDA